MQPAALAARSIGVMQQAALAALAARTIGVMQQAAFKCFIVQAPAPWTKRPYLTLLEKRCQIAIGLELPC